MKKKRLLAIMLVMVMCVCLIPNNLTKATVNAPDTEAVTDDGVDAADNDIDAGAGDYSNTDNTALPEGVVVDEINMVGDGGVTTPVNPGDGQGTLTVSSVSFLVNNSPVSADNPITDGSSVTLLVNFQINNTSGYYKSYTMNLNALKGVDNLNSGKLDFGPTQVGAFTIDNKDNIATVSVDWSKMDTTKNNYTGTLASVATVNIDECDTKSNDKAEIVIANQRYSLPYQLPDSTVTIGKSALGNVVTTEDGNHYQKYVLTAKAEKGNSTDIVITDTLTDNLEFVNSGEYGTPVMTGADSSKLTFSDGKFTIDKLSKGETATIEYYVRVKNEAYNGGSCKDYNKASLTYVNNKGKTITGNTTNNIYANLKFLQVNNKYGIYDKAGQITWTIEIVGGDINNYSLIDSETSGNEAITPTNRSDITVTYNNSELGTINEFPTSLDSFEVSDSTVKLKAGEILKFQYTETYDIKSADPVNGMKVTNTAKINNNTGEKSNWQYALGEIGVSANKSFISYDASTRQLTWKSQVTIPKGLTNVVYKDVIDSSNGHSVVAGSIYVGTVDSYSLGTGDNLYDDRKYTAAAGNKGFNYTLVGEIALTGNTTYYIYYKTAVDDGTSVTYFTNKESLDFTYAGKEYKDKGIDSASYQTKTLDSKQCRYDTGSDKVYWGIIINRKNIGLGDKDTYKLVDTLPEGLSYVDGSITVKNGWSNNDLGDSAVADVAKADRTITIDATDIVKNSTSEKITIWYATTFDDINEAVSQKKYTNTVYPMYNDNKINENVSCDKYIQFDKGKVLDKSYSYDSGSVVTYTVKVNSAGIKLSTDDKIKALTIKDTLGQSLSYLSDTGVTLKNTRTGDVTYPVVTVDSVTNSISFEISDETPYEITYKASLNLPVGTDAATLSGDATDAVSNSIEILGSRINTLSAKSVFRNKVSKNYGSVSPTNVSLTICKVDEDNSAKGLEGATFRIVEVKPSGDSFVEVNEIAEITTGEYGTATCTSLVYDRYYMYEEISAPAGYAVDENAKGYIIYEGNNINTVVPAPAGYNVNHVYNNISVATVTVTNKEVDTGTLKITKTIKGDVTKEEAEGALKFTVTNNDTKTSANYTLKDFTLNDGVYELVLDNTPAGGYMVEETVTDISGYELTGVSYTVNGNTSSGQAAEAAVSKNETTTVAFEDSYEEIVNAGKLVITKTIEGDVTKEEAEGALIFEVLNKSTGASVTYRLSEFDYNAETNTYTKELERSAGGYKVTEVVTDINGYELTSVSYTINGTTVSGNGAEVTVVKDTTQTVAYKDSYEKLTGTLVITKTIEGDVTKEEAEGALKFEVKNLTTGVSMVYTLADFTYDETTRIYTKEINCRAGEYTVTEIVTDINGYVLAGVNYTIDGGATTDGKAASVTVSEGKTTTVAYRDSYKKAQETSTNGVKTGDRAPIAIIAVVMVAALAGIVFVIRRKKTS